MNSSLWIACGVAILATMIALMVLRPVAVQVGWVDCPAGRKCHEGKIPLIGGLCFYFGSLLAAFVLGMDALGWVVFVLGGLILFVGAVDDGHELGVRPRLACQFLIAIAFVWMTGASVNQTGLEWAGKDLLLGAWGVPLTVLGIVAVINAFNLLDGMDGLAGSVAMVAMAFLFAASGGSVALLAILCAALVPFLVANLGWWPHHKVFMGDAGSTFLGFVVAATAVYAVSAQPADVRMVDGLWFMAVPLMDTLAVMVRRIREGDSPFQPDNNHLHHLVLRTGCTRSMTLGLIVGSSVAFSAVGWMLRAASPQASLGALLMVSVVYVAGFEGFLRAMCFLFRTGAPSGQSTPAPTARNAMIRKGRA